MQKERKSKKALEERLAAAEATIAATEAAKLSDTERLTAENAAIIAERDALKVEQTVTAKANLVRAAAKDFADPEDAIAQLRAAGSLDGIETAEEAETAVKALSVAKPYLLRASGAETVTRPGIEQVLRDGLGINEEGAKPPAAGDDGITLSRAQLLALSNDEMHDLQVNHPAKYQRSIESQSK